jgi:hypothetical protein
MTDTSPPPPSSIRVTGRFDPELSRGLWLVTWLLLIPHLIVLAVLGAVFWVLRPLSAGVLLGGGALLLLGVVGIAVAARARPDEGRVAVG